ncbi:hypothetical protein H0H93_003320 [Arthromyces matolae]|nr:hypothetical protein H0H93_003320 [Arthromyces matolae]
MPRIRKKTSNRQNTRDRRKIHDKARESKKKSKKAAKTNTQWKSKHSKDPGIPNNFPFKDQILAEVAEQRRLEAEEKQRKQAERKALRAKAKNGGVEVEVDEEESGEEPAVELEELKGLQVGNDTVGGLGAKELRLAKTFSRPKPVAESESDDEDEVPVLINRDLPNLQAVLDVADVVVEVLDARDPLPCRSSHLEDLVTAKPGQRLLLVLNKIGMLTSSVIADTCPLESVTAWAGSLRAQHPTALFRSATAFLPSASEAPSKIKGKGKGKAPVDDGIGVDSVLECLGQWAKIKKGDKPLTVAVVGVTNAGKSSFINSLVRSSALPVYTLESSSRGPTTTELPQEVVVEVQGTQVRLIDTPGLSWEVDESTDDLNPLRARDILLRSKGRIDRLKDPTFVVSDIVARSNTEDLMLLYSLPAFMEGDANSFLSGLARSKQLVKKHGKLDLIGASRILLRDWNTGKFARYSNPPTTPSASTPKTKDVGLKKLYEGGAAILETIVPRKELRKSVDLVRLVPREVDARKVVLQEPWIQEEDSEDEHSDFAGLDEGDSLQGDDGEDVNDDQSVEDGDSEDEEEGEAEEEGEEEQSAPLSKKQKRKRTDDPLPGPPSKKVAFAPEPKGSKQARRAVSGGNKPLDKTSGKPKGPAKVKPASAKVQKKAANALAIKNKAGDGSDEAYDFANCEMYDSDGESVIHYFSRLPIELQVEVFKECVGPFPRFSATATPLLICQVCSSWRRIGRSTPALWTSFELNISSSYLPTTCPTRDQNRTNALRRWLKLSGDHSPLFFRVIQENSAQFPDTSLAQVLGVLAPHARRWRHVSFKMASYGMSYLQNIPPSSLLELQSFQVDLRGLSHFAVDIPTTTIPWKQLTSFELSFDYEQLLTLDECLEILGQCDNLTACAINADCVLRHRRSENPFLPGPRLRHLQLNLQSGPQSAADITRLPASSLVSFMEYLAPMPLSSLSLRWLIKRNRDDSWLTEERLGFIESLKSFAATLGSLNLEYFPTSDKHMVDCLQPLQGLSHLGLRFSLADRGGDPITDSFLGEKALSSPAFLPSLESIFIQCPGTHFTTSRVIDLVHSRIKRSNIATHLRKFVINTLTPICTPELQQMFKVWDQEGLSVTVQHLRVH